MDLHPGSDKSFLDQLLCDLSIASDSVNYLDCTAPMPEDQLAKGLAIPLFGLGYQVVLRQLRERWTGYQDFVFLSPIQRISGRFYSERGAQGFILGLELWGQRWKTVMTGPATRIVFPMDFTYKSVNAYLFLEPEPVLVDCGLKTAPSREALTTHLAEAGLRIADLSRVVLTHPHIDHIGLAAQIASESEAEIWVSELAFPALTDQMVEAPEQESFLRTFMCKCGFGEVAMGYLEAYELYIASLRPQIPPECLRTFPLDGQVRIGERDWQVLYAPGHHNRQTCFYQPDTRRLLSADMLLPKTPAPVIEPSLADPAQREHGLPQLMTSYQRFFELEVEQVYPGHGKPFQNHRALIDRQRARIQTRKDQCLRLIQSGVQHIPELVNAMYQHIPPGERLAGLAMLVGYLDVLLAEGQVWREEEAGVWRYHALSG